MRIFICLALVLVFSTAQAKTLVTTVNGADISIEYSLINHEIRETDKDRGNQTSAMACSFLIYNHLSRGDIQATARLSTEPLKSAGKWNRYLERVGSEFFIKIMSEYFTSGNSVLAEFVIADETMLVVRTEDGYAGQFYKKVDGRYLMIENPAAGNTFGRIIEMLQEDKLKL